MMHEEWRDVIGYEGRYKVDDWRELMERYLPEDKEVKR